MMQRWWPRASTFARHRALACLMVLSAALTVAVVANAVHIIALKWRNLAQSTGMDDARVVLVQAHDFSEAAGSAANRAHVLSMLRALPGAKAAVSVSTMAFVNDYTTPIATRPRGESVVSAGVYRGSPGYMEALGIRVLTGSGFAPADYTNDDTAATVLLTRALAMRLFGSEHAVGRTVWLDSGHAVVVKGVTNDVLRPRPSLTDPEANPLVLFVPQTRDGASTTFVVQARDPATATHLPQAIRLAFEREGGEWGIERIAPLEAVRDAFFAHELAVVQTLSAAVIVMLIVSMLGLGGLSTLAIAQRRRSIGIMRAVGATRLDVITLLTAEITSVMAIGAGAGACFAYVIGQRLTTMHGIAPISPGSIALSVLCVLMLGWACVLKPAIAATRVMPRDAIEQG